MLERTVTTVVPNELVRHLRQNKIALISATQKRPTPARASQLFLFFFPTKIFRYTGEGFLFRFVYKELQVSNSRIQNKLHLFEIIDFFGLIFCRTLRLRVKRPQSTQWHQSRSDTEAGLHDLGPENQLLILGILDDFRVPYGGNTPRHLRSPTLNENKNLSLKNVLENATKKLGEKNVLGISHNTASKNTFAGANMQDSPWQPQVPSARIDETTTTTGASVCVARGSTRKTMTQES